MKKKILSITILILILLCNLCVYATDEQTEIPSKYDLRNDINIRVENQGKRGWCSTYASTKMIETYLQKTKGISYNLSEAYQVYSEASYFGGFDERRVDTQTINANSSSYQAHIGKQVLESDFPTKDYEFTEENKKKFDNASKKAVIKAIKDIKYTKKDKNEIKNYIINNGGISAIITVDEQWDNDIKAIYRNVTNEINRGFHGIVIIGWDDNYSRNNFNSNNRPNDNGAWLVLNSWGKDWGNNGTAWVSYEDVEITTIQVQGIEKITLKGELNSDFIYGIVNNSILATITPDDEIEDIEGWGHVEGYIQYSKVFTEPFEPYTIELKSKTDGATTTVEVNIPKETFEYDINKSITIGENNKTNREDILLIIYIGLFILLIILLIAKRLRKHNEKEIKDKSKTKKLRNRIIIIIFILLVLAIIFIL